MKKDSNSDLGTQFDYGIAGQVQEVGRAAHRLEGRDAAPEPRDGEVVGEQVRADGHEQPGPQRPVETADDVRSPAA